MTRIIIGSDHGGFKLKRDVIAYLENNNYTVLDLGCYTEEAVDYPIIAKSVAKEVLTTGDRGVLICGTGIGVSIAANRFEGIRASHCTDTFTAKLTRMHNDSNILCLGGRITGVDLALDILEVWLNTDFQHGRHKRRIDMIEQWRIE